MCRPVHEVHIEAGGEEVIQPAIAAVGRAHPVGGLPATAVHEHQRIRVALLRGQLETHVHLPFDRMAIARRRACRAGHLHLFRAHAHPEEPLVAQVDRTGLAACEGAALRQQRGGGGKQQGGERAPSGADDAGHTGPP
jgi:hypothetical protein